MTRRGERRPLHLEHPSRECMRDNGCVAAFALFPGWGKGGAAAAPPAVTEVNVLPQRSERAQRVEAERGFRVTRVTNKKRGFRVIRVTTREHPPRPAASTRPSGRRST